MPRKADATRATRKKDWADAFFHGLEETHLVSEAAKRAGIHRVTAWRRRQDDEAFAERWKDVEERSTEILEQIAVRRAAAGSDVLLMFILKSRRPEVYREHHRVEHTGPGGAGSVPINLSVDVSEAAHEFLARLRDAG